MWCMDDEELAGPPARPSRLPETRAGRSRLLRRNSSEYIRRMGRPEIDRLLLSLSKTLGLTYEETIMERDELYNIDWVYVPDRLKE